MIEWLLAKDWYIWWVGITLIFPFAIWFLALICSIGFVFMSHGNPQAGVYASWTISSSLITLALTAATLYIVYIMYLKLYIPKIILLYNAASIVCIFVGFFSITNFIKKRKQILY